MRAEAIVDLSAIKHNVELLKKTAGTKLLAVVKPMHMDMDLFLLRRLQFLLALIT